MSRGCNTGDVGSLPSKKINRVADMSAYDTLPRATRAFLQDAPLDCCAADFQELIDLTGDEATVLSAAGRAMQTALDQLRSDGVYAPKRGEHG